MTWVLTTQGLMDLADLDVKESATMSENARVVATEWRHKGKMVRRDVHVIVLRPPEIGVKYGE